MKLLKIHLIALFLLALAGDGVKTTTVDIIHRHSPFSPFYDPSLSDTEITIQSFLRSIARSQSCLTDTTPGECKGAETLLYSSGDYLIKIYIGTPPKVQYVVADTGSSFNWLQCQPCDVCFKQDFPVFNPAESNTFGWVGCYTDVCDSVASYIFTSCAVDGQGHSYCSYYTSDDDTSYTSGQVVLEKVGFSVNVTKQIKMGCARNTTAIFASHESGIFGLGRSELSLLSQLAEENGRVFSHCLTRANGKPGKLRFSFVPALANRVGVSSTTLLNSTGDTYMVFLVGISVNTNNHAEVFFPEDHRLVFNSGTAATLLHTAVYKEVTRRMLLSIPISPMNDPPAPFQLCFKNRSMDELPYLYLYILGQVELRFEKEQIYVRVGDAICFTVFPHSAKFSILGSRAMVNYKIEYDTEGSTVYFQPKDCEDDDD